MGGFKLEMEVFAAEPDGGALINAVQRLQLKV
jgi:hypothetical protein